MNKKEYDEFMTYNAGFIMFSCLGIMAFVEYLTDGYAHFSIVLLLFLLAIVTEFRRVRLERLNRKFRKQQIRDLTGGRCG